MVKRLLSLALLLLLTSCGSDSGGTTGPTAVPTAISVSPASGTLDAIGATAQFSAEVRDQDGGIISGASVTWSSSDPTILSINSSSGLATAVAVGEALVSATSGTVSGSSAATVRQLPTLVQVSLTTDQLPPGSTAQATITAKDAEGHTIPSPETVWESGNLMIATVSDQGVVTAISDGLVHITGTVGSLSDSTKLSVSSALDGDQLTTLTGANGEAAVFTALGGGTHFQLSVKDGFGQPLPGATVQYADVGGKALFAFRGPGNGYAPAFLYGPVDSLLALGEPIPLSQLPEGSAHGGTGGPQAVISQAARLRIRLPSVSSSQLTVIQDALQIPTFYYDPEPASLGTDGPFRGVTCMTWDELAQDQKDRFALIPAWEDAVTSLVRSGSPSFFDPVPLEGVADVFFDTQSALAGISGEDLLAEKINLLGAMLDESSDDRRVEVSWELGDGGPPVRAALGWYEVQTNDPYCGGAVPETLTPLLSPVAGEPSTQVQGSVKVESVWGNVIPGEEVSFSLASGHGSLGGGGLSASATTNEEGIASVLWTLPSLEGDYLLSASLERQGAQPLTASIAGEVRISTVVPTQTSITMGNDHTCGLTPEDGTYCWGLNSWGELGIGVHGNGEYRSSPTKVFDSEVRGFRALSAGNDFTCALDGDGRPFCWGRNDQGQLGSGVRWNAQNIPTLVEGGFQFTQLVSGWNYSCGLTEGGAAYCWGGNDQGQLGNGTQADSIRPGPVAGGLQFKQLTAGGFHTCGIAANNMAYCWGSNEFGALGDGTLNPHLTPNPVLTAEEFSSLTAGGDHTCGRSNTGEVYCWGRNTYGQLGIGTKTDMSTPTMVEGGTGLSSVEAGGSHSCGLTEFGTPYCWGRNHLGQVGNGSLSAEKTTPTAVSGQHSFLVLRPGPFHSCGLTANGTAYCWGVNSEHQLGQGEGMLLFSNRPIDVKTELRFGGPPSS